MQKKQKSPEAVINHIDTWSGASAQQHAPNDNANKIILGSYNDYHILLLSLAC